MGEIYSKTDTANQSQGVRGVVQTAPPSRPTPAGAYQVPSASVYQGAHITRPVVTTAGGGTKYDTHLRRGILIIFSNTVLLATMLMM